MKRSPPERHEQGVYAHFPLFFWKLCNNCKKEFRREKGYRFLAGFHNGKGREYYLCSHCAPTKDIAHQYAARGRYIPPRPPAPPSAEPRTQT